MDAEQASASEKADADRIKKHIKEQHKSFKYVNETVEQALWCGCSSTWKSGLNAHFAGT